MDYLPNQLSKNVIAEGSNNYILKVNSRDRNILNEPNPFDFKIRFNRVDTKYTTYYEKGYFGSGNKWVKNDNYPTNTWSESGGYYSKTFVVNKGAIIEDQIEQIKDINVTEIVVPRYIPEDKVGLEIPCLEAMACPTSSNSVFLRGIDNTNIKYIYDNISVDGCYYNMVEINDVYSNTYYLMKESDMSNIPLNLMKNYLLFNNYHTDTIELNCQLYKIVDISNGNIVLRGKESPTKMDFLKTKLRLPKYYQDTIWYQEKDFSLGKISDCITFGANNITFDQSGESLITVDFAKDTILEVIGTHSEFGPFKSNQSITSFTGGTGGNSNQSNLTVTTVTGNGSGAQANITSDGTNITAVTISAIGNNYRAGDKLKIANNLITNSSVDIEFIIQPSHLNDTDPYRKNHYYFKIASVLHQLTLTSDPITYSDVTFNSSNNTITLNNLTNSQITYLNNISKNINTITIADTTSNNITSKTISEAYQYRSHSFIIKRSVTTDENNVSAKITFSMKINKTYPDVNLNESELSEMNTFLNDTDAGAIQNKVSISGSWIYGGQPTNTWNTLWKNIQINHLKAGIKDLLNEKLFYLSLEPFVPSRNLITNNKLNNVIGVFYPSTQSKDYIFLTGQNRQKYNSRNLQNLKDISFKLYYMNGDIVGENLKNYSLDYLELDKKQTNITFQIEQVDKYMM